MKRSFRIAIMAAVALAAGGCSLLFDGSSHSTGGATDDAGIDGAAPPESCVDHLECLESPADVFVCADRGDGSRCYELCESEAECAGHPDGLLCVAGFCSCDTDVDCLDGFCDAVAGACVECLEDAQCPTDAPLCDDFGFCVPCFGPADCDEPGLSACDLDSGRCVACVEASDCPVGDTCSASFQCVPESCDVDGDGFAADRPECAVPGEPADCADDDPDRFPGNTPICGDSRVQGCPDAAVTRVLGELGVAEIGQLAAVEVGTPSSTSTIDQISIALRTASQLASAPDAYVVWHETPDLASSTMVTFRGYNFDGSAASPRTVETDGVCSGTLDFATIDGIRLIQQSNVLRLVTTGRSTSGGSPGAYVAFFDAFPERTLLQAAGGNRCRMTIDATAPSTEPGMLDVGVAAAGGLLDLDTGGPLSRGATLLNTTRSAVSFGMATADATHTWMESSGRFVIGGTSDPRTLSGGSVDAHADDGSVSVTLDADSAGRAALTSVPTAAGPRSYFLAAADASGTVSRRSWQCGDADASCFDATADVISSHDGDPLLDATPLATTHVGLVSARERTGPSGARDIVLQVVPFDSTAGTGIDGIPLLTTREHGIAVPLIRRLGVTSRFDGEGNATLMLAAVVERTTGEQAVWATGLRFCSAP